MLLEKKGVGRPKTKMKDDAWTGFTVQILKEVKKEIEEIAVKEKRTINQQIVWFAERGLEQYKSQSQA